MVLRIDVQVESGVRVTDAAVTVDGEGTVAFSVDGTIVVTELDADDGLL
ncbi:hypothetical protein ACFQDG_14025 [Natronoarchaeum mannanilyticum]|uniref:Uncharacterized protein n=1 Tax=Natronoarchaeum mannanilyticum TaxID=926360 RepID=A0AAV3T7A4_9EURY